MAESNDELADRDIDSESVGPSAKKKTNSAEAFYTKPSSQRNGRKHGHLCQLYLEAPTLLDATYVQRISAVAIRVWLMSRITLLAKATRS